MYLLSSIPHIVTLVAPPFANLFMRINIWLSYVVAICLLITTFPMIYIMPESIKHIATKPSPTDSAEPSPSTEEEDGLLAPPVEDVQQESHDVPLSWRTCLNPTWFKEITAMVRTPGLLFCFTLFFFDPIALISKAFVYQHASESFSWDLASTTWLRFSQALGASLVTVVALPSLSVILNRRGFRAQKLDLNVIRASLFIAAVGFCVLWQSRSGWMIVAGAYPPNPSQTSLLTSTLSLCSTLHLWPLRRSPTRPSRPRHFPDRSRKEQQNVHHRSRNRSRGETHRRTEHGETFLDWEERGTWVQGNMFLGFVGEFGVFSFRWLWVLS